MDYSLLLGIHDIAKAEMDGVMQNESEDDAVEVRLVAFNIKYCNINLLVKWVQYRLCMSLATKLYNLEIL